VFWAYFAFWTIFVVQGVVRVSVSGSVASWYFFGEQRGPSSPSLSATKRAMTTSFGSVCFGAMIVAFLATLRALVSVGRGNNSNNFARCLAECILGCLERIMAYFNTYAFTHIAIYGQSYIESAKMTWEFMKSFVWTAVINDSLYSTVITLIIVCDMIWIPVVAVYTSHHNLWIAVVAVFSAAAVHAVILYVVPCAVTALFVCIAENGEVLGINHPQFKAEVEEAIAVLGESPCSC